MGTQQRTQLHINLIFAIHSIIFLVDIGSCAHIPSFSNKEGSDQNIIGCLPCFEKHLLKVYYDKHESLPDSEFQRLLAQKLCSFDSCKGLVAVPNSTLKLSALRRHLIGEGSHRRLLSWMEFDNPLDAKSMFSLNSCEAVVIERLPSGVFADPFELQRLVQRGVFIDAAVFGDTNLELPSALSNCSAVEVHMTIDHTLVSRPGKGFGIFLELPLHARYPPLDGIGGYSRVEMGSPDIFFRCKVGERRIPCLWIFIPWDKELMKDQEPIWQIPCGSRSHAGIVSVITFVSALASAVVIVLAAIFLHNHDATSKEN